MSRFFLSFFATLLVVIAFSWIWVLKQPMAFFSDSYPLWKSKIDMAHTLPPASVALLGDSRAEGDLIPDKIAPDLYDLGLDGASPIDLYAMARVLVASPHPPRAVLFTINPLHFMVAEVFWTFGSQYGLHDYAALEQIRADARRSDDLSLWNPTDIEFKHLRPIFGGPTFGDIAIRLDEELITSGFPSYSFPSLLNGRLFLREANNEKVYERVMQTRGYKSHGLGQGPLKTEAATVLTDFVPSPILDLYCEKTLIVFQEKNIPVYYVGTPRSDLSAAAMTPEFSASFIAYLKTMETRFPNFHVLGDPYPSRPAADFNDPAHLSPAGAESFSAQVAEMLRQNSIEK